jgi:hypothetical protein
MRFTSHTRYNNIRLLLPKLPINAVSFGDQPFGLASLNTDGGLGDIVLNNWARGNGKVGNFRHIMSQFDISVFQEVHCDQLEIDNFQRVWGDAYLVVSSFGPIRSHGGLISAFKLSWIRTFSHHFSVDIEPGRCIASFFLRNHLTIIIINIHLLPSWTTAQKIDIFQRIRSLLPAYGNAAWFLAGDLNISYDGSIDIRDDVDNDGALRGRKLLTDMLNILEEPTELFQPFPTF